LSIPAVAAEVGIEEGDGTNFILGAQSSTIHNITQHDQHQPCIEGVVDLELVSHLVTGVTNSEFVDLLQHDVQHPQHLEEKSEEDQHLLQNSNLPTSSDTAYLSLSADPFVHTLVEVHNHNEKEPGDVDGSGYSVQKSFVSRPRSDTEVSREAFLLSVPKADDDENKHYSSTDNDTYVLAVPETKGVAGFLQASTANNDEDAINTRHVFDPLPTDITNLDLRVSIISEGLQEVVHLDVVVDRQVPFIGYVILVSGLFALSSIGAALDLQHDVTPEIKIFWRLSTTSILFVMLAAKTNRISRKEFDSFTWKEWLELSFASANYALMNTTFAVSLEMTSLINAFILSNMASLIMIGWKFMTGVEVLCFEGLGSLIGFVGALVCAAGSGDSEDTNEDTSSREYFGDILAFSASIGVAIYLTIAKRLRTKIDLVLFMFLVFSLSSVFLLIYITVCSGQQYEFSFDPSIGLFGWLNLRGDRLPLELYVAIICNGVGTMGYIAILKYFDAVVVSMVMLCEPIDATFIGMVVGVSTLPSIPTWIGNAIVIIGSAMVIRTGSKKSDMIDATKALQHFEEDELNRSLKKNDMQSPKLMRSPLIVNKQDVEDVEFESVGKKTRTTGGSGSRVVWSSMKCR